VITLHAFLSNPLEQYIPSKEQGLNEMDGLNVRLDSISFFGLTIEDYS